MKKPRNNYRWRKMQIGDHFIAPSEVKEQTMRTLAYLAGLRTGKRFSVAVTPQGVKCWRVQ